MTEADGGLRCASSDLRLNRLEPSLLLGLSSVVLGAGCYLERGHLNDGGGLTESVLEGP